MAAVASSLRPIDSLEALVLVDNVTDSLSTVPPGVVNENARLLQAGMKQMSGEGKCCAHHGLSLVLAARCDGMTRFVMFDAGPEAYTLARNGRNLGVPFRDIEAIALSHGHWDHAGGLLEAVRAVFEANGGRRVPMHMNEGMFARRGTALSSGGVLPARDIPGIDELAVAGADVVVAPGERLLGADCFYLSGEIPRVTPFERGLPGHMRLAGDGATWEPDPWILDERYLAVHVKDKGIVVFSMCSHAGVINVLTDARDRFGGLPLHAVMGGFHLSGPGVESIIPETVLALMSFGLKRIVPAHCTGWRAFTALSNACGDERVLMPSAVGRAFVF